MRADIPYYRAQREVTGFSGSLSGINTELYMLDWYLDGSPDYNIDEIINRVLSDVDQALETIDIIEKIIEET